MASFKPELFDIDSVMNYYELNCNKFPNWRIYAGHSVNKDFLRFEVVGDASNAAAELSNSLQAIKYNAKNTNPYTLQLFAHEGKKGDSRSIIFQLNDPMQGAGQIVGGFVGGGHSPEMLRLLEKQNETLNLLASKISAIEAKQNEQDEIEEDEDENGDLIGGLLKNPEFQAKAIEFVSGLFTPKQPAAIAGIENNEIKVLQMASELLACDPLFFDVLKAVYEKELKKPGTIKKLHGYLNFL